jgi:hypothetical protein
MGRRRYLQSGDVGRGKGGGVNRETPVDRFAEALHRDAIAERAAEREASKLEPLAIVITDQAELKRIYELAKDSTSKPVAFLRRHIRVSVRELAARH